MFTGSRGGSRAAFQDIQKNPANVTKYENNPKVKQTMEKLTAINLVLSDMRKFLVNYSNKGTTNKILAACVDSIIECVV